MKKQLAVLAVAVFLLSGCATTAPAFRRSINDFHYTEKPDICFFPQNQSTWDGYKITNKNWNKLDDYLKLMFITEAVQELERKNTVRIAMADGSRTLRALNYGIDKINRDMPKVELLVIDFLYDVFKDAKLVTVRQVRIINR